LESDRSLANKKILITCGPVWTRIDPVRVISNISSGEMGHTLCRLLLAQRAKVTLLQGPTTHGFQHSKITLRTFTYFEELSALLSQELRRHHYDIVIHAAAVSDYQLKKASGQKISSELSCLRLNLVPTPKLITRIKKINPKVFLVGFKLQTCNDATLLFKNTKKLIAKTSCDMVVANILTNKNYKAFLINKDNKLMASANSRKKIAEKLINALKDLR